MDFIRCLILLFISSSVSAQQPRVLDAGDAGPPTDWSDGASTLWPAPPSPSDGSIPPPNWQPIDMPDSPGWVPEEPQKPAYKHTPNHISIPNIQYQHRPEFDYADALAKSMLFYEAQKSGPLPETHRVNWRGDSAVNDGKDVGVDLSGGYYDGGGYIKYGFPMAYTTTMLSWGIIRYRRTYKAIGQLNHALDTIRWATDYFLKCKTGPMEFYGQVSDQESDSRYVGVPEKMSYLRKSYKVSEDRPGSDLVGETAAALAAASIVFYETDREYSELLIDHAKDLFDFAGVYKGNYHDSIKPAGKAYRSHSGYKDEIAWAAAWIYRRTGDNTFLREAKKAYKAGKLQTQAIMFSWDDKKVGVQMLLAEVTGRDVYKSPVRQFCQWCLPGGRSSHTPGGLLYLADWGPLRYAANAAFICSLAAEIGISSSEYRLFALKQMGYILGSTGRSYVVGFGVNPPTKYYHRASYCPPPPTPCPAFSSNYDNVHVLYGALVGGPSETDEFLNVIEKREQSSVALDYNAGFQSALAALLDVHIYGQQDRPKIDKPGKITTEEDLLNMTKAEVVEEDGTIVYNYSDALRKSVIFYEAQRSGVLTLDNRIPWRADSGSFDGSAMNVSLIGGYYDGGDFVKYTFPLAFTVTTMSWGVVRYSDAYDAAKQLPFVLDGIKWGVDYLMACHLQAYVLVAQVGDPGIEALTWDRPEYLSETSKRPVSLITWQKPGSDVVAEVAAAFAAASLAFENIDGSYKEILLKRAKSLFTFATTYKGTYTEHVRSAIRLYNSTGYQDELAWAALWLYKATEDSSYLNTAKTIYNNFLLTTPKTFSYDVKTAGVHLLMAEETNDPAELAKFCNWVTREAKTTPKGLFYVAKPPTKHAANVALILMMAAEKFPDHPDSSTWKYYARDQIRYLLGSTGQSYVIGYGKKFPTHPYHKASSCPRIPQPCGMTYRTSTTPNPQILIGALVAGPDSNDTYNDVRIKAAQTAVSLDTNAGFQSAVAGLLHLEMNGMLNAASSITLKHNFLFILTVFIKSMSHLILP